MLIRTQYPLLLSERPFQDFAVQPGLWLIHLLPEHASLVMLLDRGCPVQTAKNSLQEFYQIELHHRVGPLRSQSNLRLVSRGNPTKG